MRALANEIEEVLEVKECPLCALMRPEEFNFMADVTSQCCFDHKAEAHLMEEGLCNFHAWEMGKIAGHDTYALILIGFLRKEQMSWPNATAVTTACAEHQGGRRNSCLICRWSEDRESFWIHRFIERMEDENFQKQYEKSIGLCLPHLWKALPLAGSETIRSLWMTSGRKALSELEEKLDQWRNSKESRFFGRGSSQLGIAAQKLFGRRGTLTHREVR